MIWRIFKSEHFSIIRLFKGNMRTVGIYFLLLSGLSTIIYNAAIVYLTKYYDIDKGYLEKVGHLEGTHILQIYGRKIDIIMLLNWTLTFMNMFKVTALFILIGLWLPCAYNFATKKSENVFPTESEINLNLYSHNNLREAISHASIITFSSLYAFLRIPLVILLDINYNYAPEKTMIFYRSVFYGSELYLTVLFFLILETRFISTLFNKDKENKKTVENVNLLILLLTVDSFIRYYINIIAIPVEITSFSEHILKKIGFATQATILILLVNFYCPLPLQIYENTESNEKVFWRGNDQPKLTYNNVVLGRDMSSPLVNECSNSAVVEFEDYRQDCQGK